MPLSKWVKACFIGGSINKEPELPAARPGFAFGPCYHSGTGACCAQQQAPHTVNSDIIDAVKLPQYVAFQPSDKLAEKFARAFDHGCNDAVVYYSDLDLPYTHHSSSPRLGLNALQSSNTLGASSDFLSGSCAFPIAHPLRTRTTTGLETGLDQPGAPRWRSSGTGVFDSESCAAGESDTAIPVLVPTESTSTTASTPAAPLRCHTAPVTMNVVDELSSYLVGLPKVHAPNPQRFRRTVTEPAIRLEALSPSNQDCDQYFKAGLRNKELVGGCFMMHNSEPGFSSRQTPSLSQAASAEAFNGEIQLLPLCLGNYTCPSITQPLPMLTTPFAAAAALPAVELIDRPSVSSLSQSLMATTARSSMSLSMWGAHGGCQQAPSATLSGASSTAAAAFGTTVDVFSENPELAGMWGSEVSSVSPTENLL